MFLKFSKELESYTKKEYVIRIEEKLQHFVKQVNLIQKKLKDNQQADFVKLQKIVTEN